MLAGPMFDAIGPEAYGDPVHAGDPRGDRARPAAPPRPTGGAVWIETVRDACADLAGKALVGELAVEPLRDRRRARPALRRRSRWPGCRSARSTTRIRELKSKLQRINPVAHKDEYLALAGELFSLEQHARALREQAAGGL